MDKLQQTFNPRLQGSFGNRLATNLPTALAGGAGAPTFGQGFGGALQGIQEQQRYQQQQEDLAQQRSLQMQQFQAQLAQYQQQQANANRDYQLRIQTEQRLGQPSYSLLRPPSDTGGPVQRINMDTGIAEPVMLGSNAYVGQLPLTPQQNVPNLPGGPLIEQPANTLGSLQRANIVDPSNPQRTLTANYSPQTGSFYDQNLRQIPNAQLAPDTGGELMQISTIDANGKPVTRIVPRVAGAEYPAAPTADMRNREAARGLVVPGIDIIEKLSQKVITKNNAAIQRATAAGRAIETVVGNDPDYRTYQDARLALAGNLAVAQQGSRPSDADIKAIWLPLIPDAFRDTADSAAQKWEIIRVMSGIAASPSTAAPPPGARIRDYTQVGTP